MDLPKKCSLPQKDENFTKGNSILFLQRVAISPKLKDANSSQVNEVHFPNKGVSFLKRIREKEIRFTKELILIPLKEIHLCQVPRSARVLGGCGAVGGIA